MAATAESLVALGAELSEEGRWAEAAEAYRRAAAIDPDWPDPWYNLGLDFKRQGLWVESREANRRATHLDGDDRDAWWNLGIAATALNDWSTAREAWARCGIVIPDGEGPPKLDYGPVPIRLNPRTDGEVVWAHRIDPARAVLANVPLPGSGFREGDTVLHDGAPSGRRILGSREVPVFDALQLLEISPRRTTEVRALAELPMDMEALVGHAESAALRMEDWTVSVSKLCRSCSEGVPHERHEAVEGEWKQERHLGLSSDTEEDAISLLRTWARGRHGRRILELRYHPGPEHQGS